MPRYFFDLLNGLGLTRDEEGSELSDPGAARNRAIREAQSIMANEVLEGRLDMSGRIILRSEDGVLFELPFEEALTIKRAQEGAKEESDLDRKTH